MTPPLLRTQSLSLNIGDKCICQPLDFSISAGQCWGLLGQNGIGKTTLLHTFAHLRPIENGKVFLFDQCTTAWKRKALAQRLGVLIQENSDAFPSTVLETALIGRHPYASPWRSETDEDIALAMQALQEVELEGLAHRQVNTLSGGERQRLAIATLLVQAPDLYLLDEPSNHLDLRFQVRLLNLLTTKAKAKGGALLMTLHDINLAVRFCDHLILLLGDGEVVYGPTATILTEESMQRLYQHDIIKIENHLGTVAAYLPK